MPDTNYIKRDFLQILQEDFNVEYDEFLDKFSIKLNEILSRHGNPNDSKNKTKYEVLLDALYEVQDESRLLFLFKAICYYFLEDFPEVDKNINDYRKGNLIKKEIELLEAFNRIVSIRVCRFPNAKGKALFSCTLADPGDTIFIEAEEEYRRLADKFEDYHTLRFEKENSISFIDKNKYLKEISDHSSQLLIFVGHGHEEKGLQILLNCDTIEKRLEVNEAVEIMKTMGQSAYTGILLMGCNPNKYLKEINEPGNCKFIIHSEQLVIPTIKMFLFGFFTIFIRTFDFILASEAGRMSASIRGIENPNNLLRKDFFRCSEFNTKKKEWQFIWE